jgi:hypothetical protein
MEFTLMARTISLLCSLGDITIGWNATNDAAVLPVIQQMIDNGVRFFIVRKKDKQIAVTKVTQTADSRKVVIPDASLQTLFASGLLTIGSLLVAESIGPEIARTAAEVADNDTVATQKVAGG